MPAEKQPLWGIRIRELRPNNFRLMLGTKQKGDLFVTTPALRAAIQRHHLEESQIGEIEMAVYEEQKTIISARVYPFQYGPGHLLQRMGLANLIELQIEKVMAKRFPGFSILSSSFSMRERQAQIHKRGRKPGESIPIQEAIRLSRAKAITDYQKSRLRENKSLRGKMRHAWKGFKKTISFFRGRRKK